ncbi:SulP family inorganic anion transporter [Streptomyces turgidiscabies]|uniref:Sulfate permease n=1 Tax=Streptomyces turgidiscabies (strain Car8) TaxID=698760 RepID=L7FEP6_STRT8|nr:MULTISPECIES: sulfate permease [Streptomyces]ELP69130.1 sulfate permease [Streptomyces turgidiscabies Car8]MDX3495247.1 sulfate permease [Streptomyces turgidiscabies]GAQ71125.1 putative sulfate transporter/MT1781 [Streptomyces turgidiscabies]
MSQSPGRPVPVWHRLAPGLHSLLAYRRTWLRGDLLAGVTVAAYLVPQVMAYAGVAGLPPVTGLWAILPALVLYSLLGSSRLLSVGPESTTALMTATVVGPLAAGDPGRYATLAATLAITVGLLCVAAWAVRLGFVADLLSRPVLVGYLTGVALIMIVDQLPKLTGVRTTGSAFFPQLWSFGGHLSQIHLATLLLAVVLLAFVLAVARFFPAVPGPLLAVVLATTAVAVLGLDDRHGVKVIGDVPAGLPGLAAPNLAELPHLVVAALGVLLVGYTDFILTARAFTGPADEGTGLDANQELLALGAANLGAGAVHGFPVSSSASRTALASSAGARSQAYSLFAAAAVLAVLLFLSPLLTRTPSVVLGALVVYAALRMIDLAGFRRLAAFRRRELLLALGCLAGVLALDILYGVLVAVGLSVAELLTRVARPHDAVEGVVPGVAGMHDVDDYPAARTIPGLVVYRYDSPLFFANAENFHRRALAAVDEVGDHEGPVRWFVLNTEANVEVDITALDAVEALRLELTGRGIVFALARVKQDLRDDLDAYGLTESVGTGLIFPTLPTAVAAYREWGRAQ